MDVYHSPDGGFMIDWSGDVIKALHGGISKAVRKAAFDVQARAADGPPRATGFMKSSIYVVTHNSSTYGQGIQSASVLLPEIDKPTDDQTAFVAVGANYAAYVEYGTSKMAAQPFFHPAFDAVQPVFEQALAKLQGLIAAEVASANVDVDVGGGEGE